jgi:hypothetical protein
LPNDSIANLLVTRKSLDASDTGTFVTQLETSLSCSIREAADRKRGRENKKAGAGRRRHGLE